MKTMIMTTGMIMIIRTMAMTIPNTAPTEATWSTCLVVPMPNGLTTMTRI